MKPDALIFTKNRPAQLDLLMRSIARFAQETFGCVRVCRLEAPFFDLGVARWINERKGRIVTFLCDDDVFVRPAPSAEMTPECTPVSFRLGDYDYPLSLDGCTYSVNQLLPLLDFCFSDPTQLEAGLDARRDRWPYTKFTSINPCVVGIPANRVSVSSGMPHMGQDVEELNARYMRGERIDLDAVIADVDLAGGAHQNIVYRWA